MNNFINKIETSKLSPTAQTPVNSGLVRYVGAAALSDTGSFFG
ncbi:MAG: hypothetical protein ACK4VI_05315 [Alphaproteobacteria bacterium]